MVPARVTLCLFQVELLTFSNFFHGFLVFRVCLLGPETNFLCLGVQEHRTFRSKNQEPVTFSQLWFFVSNIEAQASPPAAKMCLRDLMFCMWYGAHAGVTYRKNEFDLQTN